MVLPPERRWEAPVVFSTSGDCRRQQLALWGPREKHKNLQPLLEALQELRDRGLTAAGVVAAIHRRRVLPLVKRWLPLWEMTVEADLEGSRMSSDPLPVDDLHGRVAVALGKPDAGALSQPLMRPDRGCVSLVSVRSFFLLAGPRTTDRRISSPFSRPWRCCRKEGSPLRE